MVTIGVLPKQTGCHIETIQYYERIFCHAIFPPPELARQNESKFTEGGILLPPLSTPWAEPYLSCRGGLKPAFTTDAAIDRHTSQYSPRPQHLMSAYPSS